MIISVGPQLWRQVTSSISRFNSQAPTKAVPELRQLTIAQGKVGLTVHYMSGLKRTEKNEMEWTRKAKVRTVQLTTKHHTCIFTHTHLHTLPHTHTYAYTCINRDTYIIHTPTHMHRQTHMQAGNHWTILSVQAEGTTGSQIQSETDSTDLGSFSPRLVMAGHDTDSISDSELWSLISLSPD